MREANAREQCYAGEHKHQGPKLGVSEKAGAERPGEEPGQRERANGGCYRGITDRSFSGPGVRDPRRSRRERLRVSLTSMTPCQGRRKSPSTLRLSTLKNRWGPKLVVSTKGKVPKSQTLAGWNETGQSRRSEQAK